MPFDKLLLEMRSLFEEKASKLMLKRKLEARRWLIFHAKLILANRILIEEDELVEYLVEGIPNEALRSQAKMQRFRNKYELLDAFRTIQLPKFPLRKITPNIQHEQPNSEQQVVTANRCYNCNSVGHLANECRKYKREWGACHVCGVVGQYASNCQQRKIAPVHYVTNSMEDDDFVRSIHYKFLNSKLYYKTSLDSLIDTGSPISIIRQKFVPDVLLNKNNNVFFEIQWHK
ncbi:uncharacterized protein [Eurosta solidaginis]|uniref:uncharacterized protein n=1 Tax=Eurosta solidaginis TaxID=178769 RepID=UPI003530CC58